MIMYSCINTSIKNPKLNVTFKCKIYFIFVHLKSKYSFPLLKMNYNKKKEKITTLIFGLLGEEKDNSLFLMWALLGSNRRLILLFVDNPSASYFSKQALSKLLTEIILISSEQDDD